eukprot:TRINITY_DN14009_c0_g1_i1.p1 TRINITY_DN14009_c0_g1~~TRINITY_DN14009_c0_g1_i1.p1  ORF type:complete len:557 (-),score=121.84 TRINITY_DN14009_c0_g1_i1:81-1751(-)
MVVDQDAHQEAQAKLRRELEEFRARRAEMRSARMRDQQAVGWRPWSSMSRGKENTPTMSPYLSEKAVSSPGPVTPRSKGRAHVNAVSPLMEICQNNMCSTTSSTVAAGRTPATSSQTPSKYQVVTNQCSMLELWEERLEVPKAPTSSPLRRCGALDPTAPAADYSRSLPFLLRAALAASFPREALAASEFRPDASALAEASSCRGCSSRAEPGLPSWRSVTSMPAPPQPAEPPGQEKDLQREQPVVPKAAAVKPRQLLGRLEEVAAAPKTEPVALRHGGLLQSLVVGPPLPALPLGGDVAEPVDAIRIAAEAATKEVATRGMAAEVPAREKTVRMEEEEERRGRSKSDEEEERQREQVFKEEQREWQEELKRQQQRRKEEKEAEERQEKGDKEEEQVREHEQEDECSEVPSENDHGLDDEAELNEEDEEVELRHRIREHVIVWGECTELDSEDLLSRAFDIRQFSFFEARDRAEALVSTSERLVCEPFECIPEYPPGWPRWKIDSFELREAARAGRSQHRLSSASVERASVVPATRRLRPPSSGALVGSSSSQRLV